MRLKAAKLLSCSPRGVVIDECDGKPFLPHTPNLHFSLSHSAGHIAIASSPLVTGVDIERYDPARPVQAIADEFFHEQEKRTLSRLPGETRQLAFYRLWTQKEALVKALGTGLDFPLDAFAVKLSGGSVHFEPGIYQCGPWFTGTLECDPGVSLAIALPEPVQGIRVHNALPCMQDKTPRQEGDHAPALA